MNTLYASIPEAINYFHHNEEALQKLKECGKMNGMTQDKFTLKDLLKAEIKTHLALIQVRIFQSKSFKSTGNNGLNRFI